MCQIRNFRIPNPKLPDLPWQQSYNVHVRLIVSLTTRLGYLSTEINQRLLWCIPLDSTTYLNSRSKINYILTSWASLFHPMSCVDQSQSEVCIQSWLLYFEHIFLELVTLNLFLWMKSTSSSSHRLHNKILERLILSNMNTTHDQDSSSWTQRTFRHPSIGFSAQPQLPFSKLST